MSSNGQAAVATKQQTAEQQMAALQEQEAKLTRLKEQIEAKQKKEVVALGDSATWVNRGKDGYVETFYKYVQLNEGSHFFRIGNKPGHYNDNDKWIKGAPNFTMGGKGWNQLNQISNINLIKPPTIHVEGRETTNPYIERDKRSDVIRSVWTRVIGIGYAPTGNLVVVDKTLVLNLKTYLLQDLQAKIKKSPVCGTWGMEDDKPEQWIHTTVDGYGKKAKETDTVIKPRQLANLRFYPVEDIGDVYAGLWVDMAHCDIQAALNESTNRRKTADRTCDTMVCNRALKAHPAIGDPDITTLYDSGSKTATVRVYGYKHSMTAEVIADVAKAVGEGNLGKARELAGGSLEIIQSEGPEEATPDEGAVVFDETTAEEAAAVQSEQAEQKQNTKPTGNGTMDALGNSEAQPEEPAKSEGKAEQETKWTMPYHQQLADLCEKDNKAVVEARQTLGIMKFHIADHTEDDVRNIAEWLEGKSK